MKIHKTFSVLLVFCFFLFSFAQVQNANLVKSFVFKTFAALDSRSGTSIAPLLAKNDFYFKHPHGEIGSKREFISWVESLQQETKTFNSDVTKFIKIEARQTVTAQQLVIVELEATLTFLGLNQTTPVQLLTMQMLELAPSSKASFVVNKWTIVKVGQSSYTNRVKKLIYQIDQPAFGGFITIPSAKAIENVAVPGKLDFVWIEAEHTEFGPKEVQDLVIAAENEHLVPIVRVPKNDIDDIKKYIGTGVLGVIVPSIRTKEDAQNVVNALKYSPQGNRPAGCERGNRYLGRFLQYKSTANDEILVIVMIETKEAVDNIDQILSVQGIDLLHIGPYDLSLSLGVDMSSAELKQAIAKVEAAAMVKGIRLGGAAPTMQSARDRLARGYRFFTIPGDMELIQQGVAAYFNK